MTKSKYYLGLYWIFAIGFMISMGFGPYSLSWFIKAVPAWSMAFLLFQHKDYSLKLMGIGFLFSSAGDIFLDLDRQGYFIHGLISFLLAHVVYSVCFFKNFKFLKQRIPLTALILVYGIVVGVLLVPNLGKMLIPVMIYLLAILVMGVGAANLRGFFPLAGIGAFIFVISDSLIAINKFLTPLSWSPLAIMITYYLGHFLMGKGIIRIFEVDAVHNS